MAMCIGICFKDYYGQCSLYIWQKKCCSGKPRCYVGGLVSFYNVNPGLLRMRL